MDTMDRDTSEDKHDRNSQISFRIACHKVCKLQNGNCDSANDDKQHTNKEVCNEEEQRCSPNLKIIKTLRKKKPYPRTAFHSD
jgi:hypothetical protein